MRIFNRYLNKDNANGKDKSKPLRYDFAPNSERLKKVK